MYNLLPILIASCLLWSCDPMVDKTVRGTIDNQSTYVLAVRVREGCYSGDSHSFEVNPGESSAYRYKYSCNGHDDESDDLDITFKDYVASTYEYFFLDLSPFKRSPLAAAQTIDYLEDEHRMNWQLKASDLDATGGVGFSYLTDSFVTYYNQGLYIRPSVEGVEQIYIGVAKEELSPVLPEVPGSIDLDSTVFIPMNKKTFQTSNFYSTNGGSVVCNDYTCRKN